jgi:hypothetical protein
LTVAYKINDDHLLLLGVVHVFLSRLSDIRCYTARTAAQCAHKRQLATYKPSQCCYTNHSASQYLSVGR